MTTDGDEPATAQALAGRRPRVPWSPELGARICERVAAGEVLYTMLREDGMPTPQSIRRWAKEKADFGEALAEARRMGGRPDQGGGVSGYSSAVGNEICLRMLEGESLTDIANDPVMPCYSTIYLWRRQNPRFEAVVAAAQQGRAERFCDLGWKMAMEATPETAYLTQVRLAQLRWTAGCMAPRKFRPRLAEPDEPPVEKRILFRHFKVEEDEETGEKKVVAYCPNPETGKAEREDTPGWRPPPGIRLPA
jgi:hypothetical protein